MELTHRQKRLIFKYSPTLGTYTTLADLKGKTIDEAVDIIEHWNPNPEFWKHEAKYWMDNIDTAYDSATKLAEACAIALKHDEWLDDPDHFIWEIALEVFNGD